MTMKNKLVIFAALLLASTMAHAASVCTVTSGVHDYSGEIDNTTPGTNGYCQGEPDFYAITIFEMGLCTALPTVPTTTTPLDVSSCEVIYSNTAGATIEVNKGVSSALSGGTTTRPPNGTYNYGYAKISKDFQVRAAITFNTAVSGEPSSVASTVGAVNGTGIYCYTSGATDSEGSGPYNHSSVGPPTAKASYQSSVTCSSNSGDLANAATNIAPLTNLGGGSFAATASEGVITAYLVDGSDNLSTASTNVSSVFAVQDFTASPVVVTPTSTTADMQFTVSQGMTLSDTSGTGAWIGVGNGPFNVNITVH